jgi:HPt (histidine-containing phosphotransfer) domain-containing protein
MSAEYQQQIKDHLARQFNLTNDQIDSMILGLISTLSEHIDNLEKVLEQGDLEQLGKAGHTIKGALLNLGLNECADIAYDIEVKGKAGERGADYESMVGSMRKIINRYLS